MTISRQDLDAGQIDFADIADPAAAAMDPIHPGELLRTEWLEPLGLSAYRLAKEINVPFNRVTEIVNGKRAISAETALRLARYFRTDAQSWVNLQAVYDVEVARRALQERIDREISPRAA
jgi:addiction module HigA family antidote